MGLGVPPLRFFPKSAVVGIIEDLCCTMDVDGTVKAVEIGAESTSSSAAAREKFVMVIIYEIMTRKYASTSCHQVKLASNKRNIELIPTVSTPCRILRTGQPTANQTHATATNLPASLSMHLFFQFIGSTTSKKYGSRNYCQQQIIQ